MVEQWTDNSALFEKNNELLLTFLKKEELLKSTFTDYSRMPGPMWKIRNSFFEIVGGAGISLPTYFPKSSMVMTHEVRFLL